jgi:hypothetical protein
MQKFLALPLRRRLLIVRLGAAGLAGVIALLLLLLLLPPRRTTIIVRSYPDQAAVSSDGRSLGETPITVELKRHAVLKITLRKEGYEDAEEEISAEGEHVVVIKLNQQSAAAEPGTAPPGKGPEDDKNAGKPDGKKEPGSRGSKKPEPGVPAGDSGKPDSGKPDSGKPDSGKPDSGKPDSGKPDSGKVKKPAKAAKPAKPAKPKAKGKGGKTKGKNVVVF